MNFLSHKTVYAEKYGSTAIAKAWNAGMALANCSRDAGWSNPKKADDLSNGEIFNASWEPTAGDRKKVGLVTEPDDGEIKCEEGKDIKILFNAIEENPKDFLVKNDIYKLNNNTAKYEVVKGGNDGNHRAAEIIKKAVSKKFSFDYNKEMPKHVQYAALYSAFINSKSGCKPREDPDGVATKIYKDGKMLTIKYALAGGTNDVINIGYSISGHGGDQQASCNRIAQLMNNLADDYQRYRDSNPTIKDDINQFIVNKTDDESCETRGGTLGWIACPTLGAVSGLLEWVEDIMTELLYMKEDFYANDGVEGAWKLFRNMAYIILIPMMLVMVIGTALGTEMFSAYTVKTALPRMVFAIIFIALSFHAMVFVVEFTQDVGGGVQNLILKPFNPTGKPLTLTSVIPNTEAGSASIITGTGVIGGALISTVTGGSIVGILGAAIGLIGSAALMLLFVFVLLLFRQTMIVLLIIISPLAILPWIFPGRDKLFNTWSKTFWLMVWFYPVIMVTVAIGKAMAVVVSGGP